MKNQFLLSLYIFILFILSCRTSPEGLLLDNTAPQTSTVIDTILRAGEDRLNSQIVIQWWGDDEDGFVAGYEFSFDKIINAQTQWIFTARTDSNFVLAPPPGQDTADFYFNIRAIDNNGLKDETPARVIYPVKNSPPSISFVAGANNPVISFPVVKFYWQASDPDGEENIIAFELFWNDTTNNPYRLNINSKSATFIALNPAPGNVLCEVYENNNVSPVDSLMEGMILNDTNKLFIRAVDQSLSKSAFAISYSIFIKAPISNVLLLNAYTPPSITKENFYASGLVNNGIVVFDTLRLFETLSGNYTQLAPDNLTQSRIFNLFDVIIWFSDEAEASLSLAQKTTDDFFNDGGRLLLVTYVSSLFDEQSNFLEFTPIQEIEVPADSTLIMTDTSLVDALQPGYPDLLSTAFLTVVRPFTVVPGATALYDAELLARDNLTLNVAPWLGVSTIMAKKENASGETNFIISTVELDKLNGNTNMDALFQKILIDEFGL